MSLLAFIDPENKSSIRVAEDLAITIQKQPLDYVLCHAEGHGWNLIVDKEALYIVDWCPLIFAPVERDLMFVGAGIWDSSLMAPEEESLFYQGYGQATINQDVRVTVLNALLRTSAT